MNIKKKEIKRAIAGAIFLMLIWGVLGFLRGEGFFGGIILNIDAIGEIVSILIKVAVVIGIIWFIFNLFVKDNDEDNEK